MNANWTLAALLALAGCSGDPASMGITGPGVRPVEPPVQTGDDQTTPGVPQAGTYYGPTNGPTRGASGFWGYNN